MQTKGHAPSCSQPIRTSALPTHLLISPRPWHPPWSWTAAAYPASAVAGVWWQRTARTPDNWLPTLRTGTSRRGAGWVLKARSAVVAPYHPPWTSWGSPCSSELSPGEPQPATFANKSQSWFQDFRTHWRGRRTAEDHLDLLLLMSQRYLLSRFPGDSFTPTDLQL